MSEPRLTKANELRAMKLELEAGNDRVLLGWEESKPQALKLAQSYRVPASIHKLGLAIKVESQEANSETDGGHTVWVSLRPVKAEA